MEPWLLSLYILSCGNKHPLICSEWGGGGLPYKLVKPRRYGVMEGGSTLLIWAYIVSIKYKNPYWTMDIHSTYIVHTVTSPRK